MKLISLFLLLCLMAFNSWADQVVVGEALADDPMIAICDARTNALSKVSLPIKGYVVVKKSMTMEGSLFKAIVTVVIKD